ncbi:hypothetical protein BJ508DRAFT_175063 [Ascobolus immersus RN42]|uniref:Uncharacterized protein n=1 Tax=Ascobolus immersus RN42 TaxID=1160509 RepID=A0A3N4I5H8_ASCIM|nr:hypothetical protein BJ508DRAFT_175063 [Ascobolus immersus RN42]
MSSSVRMRLVLFFFRGFPFLSKFKLEPKLTAQVHELEEFLQTEFRYTTHRIEIHNEKRADQQVSMELSRLIYENDDDDNLHIAYYAGHGVPTAKNKDEIGFVPRSDPTVRAADFDHLPWSTIEQTLGKAHGHRLCILDCCYSGNVSRSVFAPSQDLHNFEILSASSYGGTTPGPGPNSFTKALMWALKSLLREFGDRGFTTTHLRLRIREAPEFPKTQHPAPVKEINHHARSRIVLHPLKGEHSATDVNHPESSPVLSPQSTCSIGRYVVGLSFFFEDMPDKAKIDELSVCIKKCREEVDGLCSIGWDGLARVGIAQRAIVQHFNVTQQRQQRREYLCRKYSKPFLALVRDRKSEAVGNSRPSMRKTKTLVMVKELSKFSWTGYEHSQRLSTVKESVECWQDNVQELIEMETGKPHVLAKILGSRKPAYHSFALMALAFSICLFCPLCMFVLKDAGS